MPSGEEGARCPEQCGASRMGTLLMTFRRRRRASDQEVQRRDNLPMSPADKKKYFQGNAEKLFKISAT